MDKKALRKLSYGFYIVASKKGDKFTNVRYKEGITGTPVVIDNCIAFIECRVVNFINAGTHILFIGEAVDAGFLSDGKPVTYAYYREIKGGKIHKNAPSYLKEKEDKVKKYRCIICGYVYTPEKGDPENKINPGTPFKELPNDWVCPICGAEKKQFEPME